ncbi:hypothetical protein M885DRAFT_587338 [Pelagophyceae sp. CCMP2097]|nr:hypothetical protein M885DRAFT_587338 [Pelagophyceae sp. CCMP2097]
MGLWRALRCAGWLALAQLAGAAAKGDSVASGEAGAKPVNWWSSLLTMVTGAPDDASAGDVDADYGDDDEDYFAAGAAIEKPVPPRSTRSAGAPVAAAPVAVDPDANVDDSSSDALIAWVLSSPGGAFHPAQRIQQPARGPRGIFAIDPIPIGAVLARVPWDRLVSASSLCGTVSKTKDELNLGSASAYTPYMDNMRDYDPNLPCFWPEDALALVSNLPPYDWTRHVSWYTAHCGGSVEDPVEVRAMSLNVARACSANNGEIMAPLYDLYNHRNGRWQNTLVEVQWGVAFSVRASRDIQKGDELFNSYGSGTSALFRDYGFVENLPQRWGALPGGHDFELLDNGHVQWHSKLPDRADFLVDVQPVFDELDRKVEFTPSKQADDALRYRSALSFALELCLARTTFADETARTDL